MIKVISLGGSTIVPDKINIRFLKQFRKIILDYTKKGNKVIIVTGGGRTCRDYNAAARKIVKPKEMDLHRMGIQATKLNANLMRTIFSDQAYHEVIDRPHKARTGKKVIIGCGFDPGRSSDYNTAVLAKLYKAKQIINLSNIYYVHDKDPKKYKNAKPFKELSWKQFKNLFVKHFKPGMHIPFDQEASRIAEKNKINVVITKGTDLKNLKNVLHDRKFRGTIIQ